MNTRTILALAVTYLASHCAMAESLPALIPLPQKYETAGTTRDYSNLSFTTTDKRFANTVALANRLARRPIESDLPSLTVNIQYDPTLKNPEAYQLTLPAKGDATIKASTDTGAFYALQTLLQLTRHKLSSGKIPVCTITDAPRFPWRGLMLDEARHFMGKKYVLHLLRTMAAHKMNRFHWHLTDDQGWRIEIKQYPKLTTIGSWRGPGTQAPVPKWDRKTPFAKRKYGGFYTQKDIREIVAYATSLHIQILPEIDIPGHAMAIALSYPEVLPKTDQDTGKGVQGLKGNVLSVVREENYRMLDTIFGEIADLFPGKYIHVGGDEVNVNAWKASPEHRKYMKKHGMKNPHQLQNMFMLRLEKILKKHGKTLMGWNEIMHGGELSNDTGVMAWISIGAGLNAARHHYPTVMAVGSHNYFDMKYPGRGETGHWWAGAISTQKAYSWNPLFEGQLKPDEQRHILGVHCCLWTEFCPDPTDADYKLWPRACATAEVGWTPQQQRRWSHFSTRLAHHQDYLDILEVGYRIKPPQAVIRQGVVTIRPPYAAPATILFTLDGSEPTASSSIYKNQHFTPAQGKQLRYRTLRPNGRMSKTVKGAIREPIGTWSKKNLAKKGPTTLKFNLTSTLTTPGNWIVELQYTKGKNPTRILSASILENGKPVSSATGGTTLDPKHRTTRLRLPITTLRKNATYTLKLVLDSPSGNNSSGKILFDLSPWLEPTTTLTTNVKHHADNSPNKAVNWNRSDFYWSNRNGKKGDQWLYTFEKPVSLTSIKLPTGKPNSNDDIIVDGVLEASEDGHTFKQVATFAYGTAKVKFTKPTRIKALRIRLQSDHSTWIILRDPQLK